MDSRLDQAFSSDSWGPIWKAWAAFLNKIIDQGEIDHRKVGRNRRVRFGDLMEYKEKQKQKSKAALKELAEEAQELDMGY